MLELNLVHVTGALELFSHIFATPGLDTCYVEICKLLSLLLIEPDNRMPIYKSPLMSHLKSLQRWKGSGTVICDRKRVRSLDPACFRECSLSDAMHIKRGNRGLVPSV